MLIIVTNVSICWFITTLLGDQYSCHCYITFSCVFYFENFICPGLFFFGTFYSDLFRIYWLSLITGPSFGSFILWCVCVVCVVLGMEPRTWHLPSKWTELGSFLCSPLATAAEVSRTWRRVELKNIDCFSLTTLKHVEGGQAGHKLLYFSILVISSMTVIIFFYEPNYADIDMVDVHWYFNMTFEFHLLQIYLVRLTVFFHFSIALALPSPRFLGSYTSYDYLKRNVKW